MYVHTMYIDDNSRSRKDTYSSMIFIYPVHVCVSTHLPMYVCIFVSIYHSRILYDIRVPSRYEIEI